MHYDIVLVSPSSRAINHYRPPLALMYVAEKFRREGKRVKIIDPKIKEIVRDKRFFRDRDKIVNEVSRDIFNVLGGISFDTLGITCYSPEYQEVNEFIKGFRNKYPSCSIITGGIHPTLKPEDFDDVQIFKGRYDVAMPSYDLVDMPFYCNANPYCIRGVFLRATYVLSSIGCPFNCAFCVGRKLKEYFGCGYIKTPEQLKDEVIYLKKHFKIDGFYIIDDCFSIKRDYVSRFCDVIVHSNLVWGCSAHISTMDKDLISQMAQSGCIQIDFGVERGSNEALKQVNKRQTIEQVKQVFKWCKQANIRTFANFIINIPREHSKDLRDIRLLSKEISPTVASFNIFRGYFGTAFKDRIPKKRLERWAEAANKRYNSIFQGLLGIRYWRTILSSQKKLNYIKQLWLLIKEAINQAF